jgi:hypothetical protein
MYFLTQAQTVFTQLDDKAALVYTHRITDRYTSRQVTSSPPTATYRPRCQPSGVPAAAAAKP